MQASELRDMTYEELQQQLVESKEKLFNLRFQHALGELDNKLALREAKRNIARVYTIIREKELLRA